MIVGNQFQKPNYDKIEFVFEKGNLIYDRINGELKIINAKNTKNLLFLEKWDDLILKQLNAFFKSIKRKKNFLLTRLKEDYLNIKNIKNFN